MRNVASNAILMAAAVGIVTTVTAWVVQTVRGEAAPTAALGARAAGPAKAGSPGHPEVVDLCDGSSEFLAISVESDVVFAAGLYAQDVGIDSPAEVYALDIGANRAQRVTCSNFDGPRCAYSGPSVSRDHSGMVVMRACADTDGNGRVDNFDSPSLAIVDLQAGTVLELPRLTAVNSPHWSVRDRIVFAAQPPGELETDIFTTDRTGSTLVNLTETADLLENDPSWSSDGRRIVFARGTLVTPAGAPGGTVAAEADLWIMKADGSDARMVVSFAGDVECAEYADNYCKGLPADPAFTSVDTRIVFERLLSVQENRGSGRFNIFTARTSGLDTGVANLTNDLTAYQAIPDAGPGGILFHEVDTAKPFYGLVLIDGNGGRRRVLVDGTAWTFFVGSAHWLPKARLRRAPASRLHHRP